MTWGLMVILLIIMTCEKFNLFFILPAFWGNELTAIKKSSQNGIAYQLKLRALSICTYQRRDLQPQST